MAAQASLAFGTSTNGDSQGFETVTVAVDESSVALVSGS
jgi:hypothetical protein